MRGNLKPVELKCEYIANPLGIDTTRPRFTWQLESKDRGMMQSAYRILVASSKEKLDVDKGDKWDSGRVALEDSVNIPYDGHRLTSSEKCWWKVSVWEKDGRDGRWSAPATFEMGLLEQEAWQGKWIGAVPGVPTPMLRKEFEVPGPVKRARLYVSGIGWSETYLNGGKVSDRVLDPAASEYPKTTYYVVHDVSDMLRVGSNAIGLWLGNGWYSEPENQRRYGNCPRALVQLVIETEDGKVATILSDESWKAGGSCIILNDFFHGEIYDARLETPGWNNVGFDDREWPAAEIKEAPGGVMRAQVMPSIKVIEVRKAIGLTEPAPNIYLFDFGQLFGGWARIRVKGPAGTKITIKYSGRVNKDSGFIDKSRHQTPRATDYYVMKGAPEGEVYEPRFTYHPVNYVQIEGSPSELTIEDVDGCVVHTAEDLSGGFECSNDLLNKIHLNVLWTLKNGLFGMPLDCLDREHWAWTDPATITGSLYPRKFMPIFWTKWLRDIADSQQEDGSVPIICPAYWGPQFDPAWGGNYPPLVWYLFQYFGDVRMLVEHFDGMKKCVDHMTSISEENIITTGRYGDHMVPGSEPGKEEFMSSETPKELIWTGYYYRAALVTSQVADVLGHPDDASDYARLAGRIKEAFNTRWLDRERHVYAQGAQTAQAFPLALDIVPETDRKSVIECLFKSVTEEYGNHHHTGNTGTTCLIDKLTDLGYGDVMWKIVTNKTYPGWGFMVSEGATTIWESWSLIAGCGNAESMIMWATIDEFFYNDLAGITGPDYYGPGQMTPGFKEINIRPFIPDELESVSASIMTVRGMVSSRWKKTGDGITLGITIPVNCSGKMSVPKIGLTNIKIDEGGRPVWKNGGYFSGVDGITGGMETTDFVILNVGSGDYQFTLSG